MNPEKIILTAALSEAAAKNIPALRSFAPVSRGLSLILLFESLRRQAR